MGDARWKLLGNACTWDASNRIDLIPIDDLIDHDTATDECVCGPAVDLLKSETGADVWRFIHHSLDGREANE